MNQLMNDVRSVRENLYECYFQRALHQAFTVEMLQSIELSAAVFLSHRVMRSSTALKPCPFCAQILNAREGTGNIGECKTVSSCGCYLTKALN